MRTNLKKMLKCFLFFLCCLLLVSTSFAKDEEDADSATIVASVNGKEINQAELDREVVNISQRYSSQMQGLPVPDDIESKALDSLITKELLYEASRKAQIEIDDQQVDQNLQQAISRFPDKEAFDAVLKRENITVDELKSEIRHGLAIQKYVEDTFVSKATVSDDEIKSYYDSNQELFKHPEMVKASHILVSLNSDADDTQKAEARKKIEDLAKKIKEGKDFAELASAHSDCPSSSNGGDLGFFKKGQMVKSFEDAAFSMDPGQVSPVVETRFGFHLIKVAEKQPEGTYSLDQVKPQIQQMLIREKVQQLMEKDIENLKANAEIKTFKTLDADNSK
jgi:peptidyl-prolyl cis-trans isomerase C